MTKNILKKIIKETGKPALNQILELLMLRAKRHPGRKLFDASELKLVREALLTQNLFGMDGYMVSSFEKEFARTYGTPYAVASTSGTAAIHTALGALDLNAGDEVITAPITDLGTIIPILCQNTIPVFADIDDTYQMDPEDIERKITSRTKAILVVHLFGNTCDMDRVVAIAKRHHIPLIEDCSQTHLTEYKGKYVGTIGDIGCFSFQQSKHMTTGDGGMTITSNKDYYERMKLFVDKGYARKGWGTRAYLFHAPNYRMNELTAAVGRAQLQKVKAVVEKRHAMGISMTELLTGIDDLTPVPITPGTTHSYWLYPFKLEGVDLESFCKEMIKRGVYAMAGYTGKTIYLCTESLSAKKTYGDSQLPFSWRKDKEFEYKEGLCPKAEKALETLVCIPWNESWGNKGVERAARVIRECLEKVSGKRLSNLESLLSSQANPASSPQSLGGDQPVDPRQKHSGVTSKTASSPTAFRNDKYGDGQKKFRVAIIGCGQIGRAHLDAYKRNSKVQIVAVADTDFDRAEKFAAEVKANVYKTHQQLIQSEKLDGVSLCTVPVSHLNIAIDLLNAGIHVLCEKPLALSVSQAEEMMRKAKENDRLLLTAFKLRFFDEVVKAKELLDKKMLGNILTFRIVFGGYMDMADTWYSKKEISGGGVIMDNGPHAIDLIHYLFGEIAHVSAETSNFKNLGVEDTAKINLLLKNGAAGTIDISWSAYVTSNVYFEIIGDEGAILIDFEGLSYKLKTWKDWKRVLNSSDWEDAFARQINHFVNSAINKKTTVVDEHAGFQAQKVLEAVYRSIGQTTRELI